ncbi:MAG: DUF433 domain-containing protein [Blastocatellia bacterium]
MATAQMQLLDGIIWIDPDEAGGALCFYGTRVPVKNLFDYLKRGHTLEDFLTGFPHVTREQAESVLEASQGSLHEALRAEAKQRETAHLSELILDGVNSGEATPMTADDWREIRAEVRRRAEERSRE